MEKVLTEELNLTVTTQEPTTNMYYFQGGIRAMTAETARDATPSDDQVIGLQNFLPRGTEVKNSTVQCIVVATGPDTKIVLNQGKYSYKTSSFEKQMNKVFGIQIIMLFIFDGFFTYLNYNHISQNLDQPLNHDVTEDNMGQILGFGFISLFLILMRLVPLDVIVSTELGKVYIAKNIEADAEMMMIDPVPGSNRIVGCIVHSM